MSSTKCLKVRKFSEIPGPPRIPIWGNLYLYKLDWHYHQVGPLTFGITRDALARTNDTDLSLPAVPYDGDVISSLDSSSKYLPLPINNTQAIGIIKCPNNINRESSFTLCTVRIPQGQKGVHKVEDYRNVLLHLYNKYGPLVREDLGPKNKIIHVFHLNDAKTIFSNEGPMPFIEPLQETTKLYRKTKNTSLGLGNTNGEEWYKLRSAVRKLILKPKEVQRYLPQLNKISDEFVTRLKKRRKRETDEIGDLRLEVAKWSREVSGWICFGRRLGCFDNGLKEEEAAKIIQLNKTGFKLSSNLKFSLPIYKIIPTPKWRDLVKIEEQIHKSVVDLIETEVKSNGEKLECDESFLSYLLSQKELTEKDVEMLVLSVFGDGLSTTVPALIYNLYCLAINPQIQEQVRQEVREATRGGHYISADTINNKLQLLKAFVKETFRFYPIGTEISRVIKNDLILSNYHVPKGTHVHLNQVVLFQSNKYFKEPEKFHPARWLRDGDEEIDPLLLVPFGHGTRTCAGRRLAEQDIYVSLSKILLNFELEYPKSLPPLQQTYEVLLFPREPIRIKFKPIT